MAVVIRVAPIDREVVISLTKGLAPADQSRELARFARQSLKEAQDINRASIGRVPEHTTIVDGRRGASEDSVKPNGVVTYEFHLLDDLFAWIGQKLMEASPVKTGLYQDSHVLFADGVEVAPGSPLPDASEYAFVNAQPYARKIERGLSPQAPDGVYEGVAALAARRFGNLARIKFSYRSFVGGNVGSWAAGTTLPGFEWAPETRKRVNKMKGTKRRDFLTRQPAIVITR